MKTVLPNLTLLCLFLPVLSWGQAPCGIALDEVDEFDSTRMVVTETVPIGYLINSQFETADGYKMIDEAQLLFTFSSNDTLDAMFLFLGVQEYTYRSIRSGKNMRILLDNGEVLGLLNFPDKGTFSKETNMRLYHHTAAMPLDSFYKMIYNKVEKIRIMYKGYNHTLTLLPEQQKLFQEKLLCLGRHLELFPVEP